MWQQDGERNKAGSFPRGHLWVELRWTGQTGKALLPF